MKALLACHTWLVCSVFRWRQQSSAETCTRVSFSKFANLKCAFVYMQICVFKLVRHPRLLPFMYYSEYHCAQFHTNDCRTCLEGPGSSQTVLRHMF